MVDLTSKVRVNFFRRLCKAYKSIVKRWFRCKTQSSSREGKPKRQNQTQKEYVEEGKSMNKIHSCNDVLRGNDRINSRRRLCRHRSLDNTCFPSIHSLSRQAHRKNHTLKKSRGSCESTPTPSWNNIGSLRMSPHMKSRNGSHRISTVIMFSNSSGMLKPLPIEKTLTCTLEELCFGCKKDIKITRDVLSDTGEMVPQEELLTINVQPGWTTGTKIIFEGKGNERPGAIREDIIFFISEKRHQLFRREGDDLELVVKIPLLKALTGCTISVPLLDGEMSLTLDDIIYPGYEKIIAGQGMPSAREPEKRGNLKLTFLVEFPTQLTDKQRSEVVGILLNSC